MKDKSKLIDIGKTCAIIFLLISAVCLLGKAVMNEPGSVLDGLGNLFDGTTGTSNTYLPNSESADSAAAPVFLLITKDDGSHYAVKNDNQSKEKIASQFSGYLGEALGTSGEPNEITAAQWQTALSGSGVFFDYLYPQPLSAIASWLGTEISLGAASESSRRLFLGNNNDTVFLYFMNESNKFFSCKTALSFSSVSPKIAELPAGNANFAFELGEEYETLDPYFIFSHESEALRAVTVANPIRDDFISSDLLAYFGMSSRAASKYAETDGSKVYVDGDKTLRVEASGKVLFSAASNSGVFLTRESSNLTTTDCIASCYKIVNNSIGLASGDGTIGFTGVSGPSPSTLFTVNFGYFVDGIPVTLPGNGYAASFHINNGAIVKAELFYRKYSFSGSPLIPLPEKQATEMAKLKGGEPVLSYEDKTDSVICTWIIK